MEAMKSSVNGGAGSEAKIAQKQNSSSEIHWSCC